MLRSSAPSTSSSPVRSPDPLKPPVRIRAAFLLGAVLAGRSAVWAAKPELIFHHGRVFIAPGQFAEAVAVQGRRILEVGENARILSLKGPKTRLIDLEGKALTPGFHDAHVHFTEGALSLAQADLTGTTSVAEVQDRLRNYLRKNPSSPWIVGQGWDHTAFPGQKLPAKEDLDVISATQAIVLIHVDGLSHLTWLNSAALQKAGIFRDTPDPRGGHIERDSRGEPTGLLFEAASKRMKEILPSPSRAEIKKALEKALLIASQSGVTSIQGPVDISARKELEAWREINRKGKANLRFFIWGRLEDPKEFQRLKALFSDLPPDRFHFGGLKGFLDGVISARTAALLEPYSDDSKSKGSLKYSRAGLNELVAKAHAGGFQVVFHAIGDLAVRAALDSCASLSIPRRPVEGHPFPCKIEHIEVLDPSDLPRFKALRVAASMQPSHMTYDNESQNYNPERLGDRARTAFAWKSLEEAGAILAFGTDWPVMPLNPRVNLFAATTRQHFNGRPLQGWIPRQKISLESALEHYTLDPARAIGLGEKLGSIAPGKLADLVVFDRDIFSVSGLDLLKVEVALTVFDGKIVYERPEAKPE